MDTTCEFAQSPKHDKTTGKTCREVPNGVGADGVGVKFPIFPVNCSRLPLFQENRQKTKKSEEKRKKKAKKNEKKRKSQEKRKKTKKIPPTPSTPTPLRTSQKRGYKILDLFQHKTRTSF